MAGARCAWMRGEAGPITDAPDARAKDARGRGTAGTGPGCGRSGETLDWSRGIRLHQLEHVAVPVALTVVLGQPEAGEKRLHAGDQLGQGREVPAGGVLPAAALGRLHSPLCPAALDDDAAALLAEGQRVGAQVLGVMNDGE